jgi:MFS family permease
MLVFAALVSAVTFGPMIFMQPFLTDHGVELAFIGFIQTPVRLMGMVGALVAYQVTARLGIRAAFIAAPLLMGGAYLTLGAWDAVYAFAAFPFIFFVNSLLLPPATDYLNRRIPSSQRATILSLRTMLSSLGAAILVPALGVAADEISLRAVFWINAAVVGALLPLALGLWLRADQQEREEEVAAADIGSP